MSTADAAWFPDAECSPGSVTAQIVYRATIDATCRTSRGWPKLRDERRAAHPAISASRKTVFMLRAVPSAAAAMRSLVIAMPDP